MAPNINRARTLEETTYDQTYEILSNRSILSDRFERILNFYEGGEGSRRLSNEITEMIADMNYTAPGGLPTTINTPPASRKRELISKQSLKEKIAFFVSLSGAFTINNVSDLIENLENKLTNSTDHSQKFILRHAAMNRFNVKMERKDVDLLDSSIGRIQKIVRDANLDTNTFHFGQKTDTQKIKKIEEAVRMIKALDITDEQRTTITSIGTDAAPLFEKLKPLDDLDTAYSNLSSALNNMYTHNRNGMRVHAKSAMILQSRDLRRLKIVLSVIKGTSRDTFNIEQYTKGLLTSGKIDVTESLEEVLDHEKIGEALAAANIPKEIFERLYLEHFSQELVIQAKNRLDWVKKKTFGSNTKDFEQDVNSARESQRRKIISIGDAIVGINRLPGGGIAYIAGVPATAEQRDILGSYLNRNKHVFMRGSDENDNRSITRALEIALEKNLPRTDLEERTTLRDLILEQNTNTNDLFYGDNNAFDRKNQTDNAGYKAINVARRYANWTSKHSKKYGQSVSKFLIGSGAAVGAGVGLSAIGLPAILTGVGVAVGAKYGAKGIDNGLQAYHGWLNKDRKWYGKIGVFPLKIAKLITRPLEWGTHQIDTKTDNLPDKVLKFRGRVNKIISEKVGDSEYAKKITDQKVNTTLGLLALGMNSMARGSTELTNLVSGMGLDLYDTGEKQRIFNQMYSARNATALQELADRTNMQALIQEDMGLFEKDGYVDGLDVVKESGSEKEKAAAKTFKSMSKIIKPLKEKISDKATNSPNERIKEAMKELEGLFKDWEQVLNSDDDFGDKKTGIDAIIDKINGYLGNGTTSGIVYDTQNEINRNNTRVNNHQTQITNINNQITGLAGPGIANQVKALTDAQKVHQDAIIEIEKESRILQRAQNELFPLVDIALPNGLRNVLLNILKSSHFFSK